MNIINSRLTSLIRKEFIQILRDPRILALVLMMPIMQLLLLGYAATNDVKNVPMAVLDQDGGPAARRLVDAYRAANYFTIVYQASSEDDLRLAIDGGSVRAGLIIPPDYSSKINGTGSAQVAFVLDGSDATVGASALSAAQMIGQYHATQIQAQRLARVGKSGASGLPLEVRTQVWYNPDLVSAYFMVPGVIGMVLFTITSILTATAVVRERERGTIEQLIVTPIRSWELILGKLIPYIILTTVDVIEILALGTLLFNVPIRGSLLTIMLLSALFQLTGLGIGLLASTVANTQQEAMLTVFFMMLPSIFLSGFFFPIEAMPKVLQFVSYLIPLRYYLVIIRSLLIKGVTANELIPQIIALALFGVGIMTLATARFRKRLD